MRTSVVGKRLRYGAVGGLFIALTCIYIGYEIYNVELRNEAFEEEIQGMTEYELCQLTYDKFGEEGLKEVGCLKEGYAGE